MVEFFFGLMRNEMNCAGMTRAFLFEPLRRAHHVCVTRKSPQTEETVRHCARQRNRAKDHAPQERRGTLNQLQPRDKTNRQILHSAWFSKHTTRPLVHTSACLKHSNFVNTDRMRKRGGPTAVHVNPFSTSVFNNSDRDVSSSFRTAQILRQGSVHQNLWNTAVFQDRLTHVQ